MRSDRRLAALLAIAALAALLLFYLLGRREGASPRRRSSKQEEPSRAPARPAPQRTATAMPSASGPTADTPQERPGRVVLRGTWGSGPGQFGHREAQESNPEGPMSLSVGPSGELLVLDQVNLRVQRFDSQGSFQGAVSIQTETAQDLTVDAEGRLLVLDRLGTPGVQIYGADGAPLGHLPVIGGEVESGGSITGLFASSTGIYVDKEHDDLVKIAGPDGQAASLEETIPGRPTRDGKLLVKAGIIDKASGEVYVQAHRPDRTLAWECPLGMPGPVLHLLLLDSDLRGRIYLGAEVGQELDEGYHGLATVVAQVSAEGRLQSSLSLPPTTSQPEESFRPLVVGDDGTIYHMVVVDGGVQVTAYTFPH